MQKLYCVYFITNKSNRVLYLGRTENILKRMYEHRNKLLDGFSKRYNLYKLVHVEVYENKEDAAAREWKLKKWRRDWKITLIEKTNPEWKDLYPGLIGEAVH